MCVCVCLAAHVVMSPTEELLVMRLLIVSCIWKKLIMWTLILSGYTCINGVVQSSMFLAVGLGSPAILLFVGFLEAETLARIILWIFYGIRS